MLRQCPLITSEPTRPCPTQQYYLSQEYPTQEACEEARKVQPNWLVCEERARVKE